MIFLPPLKNKQKAAAASTFQEQADRRRTKVASKGMSQFFCRVSLLSLFSAEPCAKALQWDPGAPFPILLLRLAQAECIIQVKPLSHQWSRNEECFLFSLYLYCWFSEKEPAPALFEGCEPMTQLNQLADCHPESAWSNLTTSFLKEKMHRKLLCSFFPLCIGFLQADVPQLIVGTAWFSGSDDDYGRCAGSTGLLCSFCRNWRFYLCCQIILLL